MSVTTKSMARPDTSDDEPEVLELLCASAGEAGNREHTREVWVWAPLLSPSGYSRVYVACAPDGCTVGVRSFMRWRFNVAGRAYHAARAMDTATHRAFQRQGVFSTLSRYSVGCLQGEGVDLVFATPGRFSVPGYLRPGWWEVGGTNPLVKAFDYRRFVAGLTASRQGRSRSSNGMAEDKSAECGAPGPDSLSKRVDVEALLRANYSLNYSLSEEARLSTDRDPSHLRWRYGPHPTVAYKAVMEGPENTPSVTAVVRTAARGGMREALVAELFIATGELAPVQDRFSRLHEVVGADYMVALTQEGSHKWQLLRRCGFCNVPKQVIRLMAREASPVPWLDMFPPANWGLSLGDVRFF